MTSPGSGPRPHHVTALGIEPMSARSVILSTLLGLHPPVESARGLVALAELFDIRAGTTRTSLSRMVANGELDSDGGSYRLTGRLLERQREQDVGRREPALDWDGTWWTAIVATDRRSASERRSFRAAMTGARMAELRPDVWLRPANVPSPPRPDGVILTHGDLDDDVEHLVGRLWDLDTIEATARTVLHALDVQVSRIAPGNDADLADSFVVSAAAIRFLRSEPRLPAALTPDEWTASRIRPVLRDYQRAFDHQIRAFFDAV